MEITPDKRASDLSSAAVTPGLDKLGVYLSLSLITDPAVSISVDQISLIAETLEAHDRANLIYRS